MQRNANAGCNLCVMYENGTGITQDASETGGGQEVSAAEKDVWDEFGDFISHEDEIADAKDYKKAFVWYEKAALQGHAHAQYCLAWLYDTGNGVAQDEHQAFVWYEKAALQGHARAQCALGGWYELHNRDYQQACAWYEKAALQSDYWGQYNLAWCYEYGKGVAQDYEKAFFWYEKSALQENEFAQLKLVIFYIKGQGTAQDSNQALKWLMKAAAHGNPEAVELLSVLGEADDTKS